MYMYMYIHTIHIVLYIHMFLVVEHKTKTHLVVEGAEDEDRADPLAEGERVQEEDAR